MLSLILYFCLFLIYNQIQIESVEISPFQKINEYSVTNQTCNSLENMIQGCSEDCLGLKFCLENQTIIVDCALQSFGINPYCNKTSNLCQSTPTKCGEEKFRCPVINGFYPDPFDCRRYYQCYYGESFEGNCSQSVFNPKIPGCKKAIPCYTFSPVNGLCKAKLGKIVVHPLDKNVYAFCDDFPIVVRCPPDNVFNLKSMNCQYDCKTYGMFPDKGDYEWYYVCQKNGLVWEPAHLKCPAGLYFNEYFNGCVAY